MTGAVLAGGKSRRMGSNKALLEFNGETIIQRVLKVVSGVFEKTMIVADDVLLYENLDARVVADIYKGAGSLGGVYTALFHSSGNHVFVAACDMPHIDAGAVKRILEAPGSYDAAVPFISGRYHPMHAVYSKRCMKPMEAMIKEGNLRLTGLMERIRVKKLVEEDFKGIPIEESVRNINTKEDLERLVTE
ncbi:MAG: hypothetical protein BMS9Abin23_0979 [Thermodesulfobacteriota bacterium]|nr:MAG: hypothetical protein BMS9Abin23_0979 [Thermodesulfobacteriota bacterium]